MNFKYIFKCQLCGQTFKDTVVYSNKDKNPFEVVQKEHLCFPQKIGDNPYHGIITTVGFEEIPED